MNNIRIRKETPMDFRQVEKITRAAFDYPARIQRGGIGCPFEHWMVHELRKRDGVNISLVAQKDGELVGHVIGSKARIVLANNENILPVMNFGPLSVLPELWRQGIGKALMKALIAQAKEDSHGAILFFGRPEYYPQFGFVPAETFGVSDCNGENYPAFFAMELMPGYLACARGGRFVASDIYDEELHRDEVKLFDQEFFR